MSSSDGVAPRESGKPTDAGAPPAPTAARRARLIERLARLKRPIIGVAAVGTVLGGLAGYWSSYRAVRTAMAPEPGASAAANTPAVTGDRRMTFAVLPFAAPSGDAEAARLALQARESTQAELESRTVLARVAPRSLVEQATATPGSMRQIGQRLDVHFLLRGNVSRGPTGHELRLSLVDVSTEIPLAERSVRADGPPHAARMPSRGIDDALSWLSLAALKQEVARARARPDTSLDARDLTYRAMVESSHENTDRPVAYAKAQQSLQRALALAPDDPLALSVTARLNLCECLRAWATDTREMERIGEAALERVLAIQPDSVLMLEVRAWTLFRRGRHEDALLVADRVMSLRPDRPDTLRVRVKALFKLGRFEQALAAVGPMLEAADHSGTQTDAAAVYFASGDDALAARLARKALVEMSAQDRADPLYGVVGLLLVAAESRAGRLDRARAALADFHALVPQARSVNEIRSWRLPHAMLPDSVAFWQALRRAGVKG